MRQTKVTSPDTLFRLFLSLIRPHLEYASPVWSPYKSGEVQSIENVQKFALKICRKAWDQNYESLLELFQVPSLEERRLYLDLCTMFKIVHNLCYFPSNIIHQHHTTRMTRVTSNRPENLYFALPSFHTNQFQNSFIPRTIEAWNSLPPELLSCSLPSSCYSHSSALRLLI